MNMFTKEIDDMFFVGDVLYYRNNDLYGYKSKETGKLTLFKTNKSKNHNMYINCKTYDKIRNLYYRGMDERINKLWDYIIDGHDAYVDINGDLIETDYIYIQYNDNDLIK